jgi:hypothetical protein
MKCCNETLESIKPLYKAVQLRMDLGRGFLIFDQNVRFKKEIVRIYRINRILNKFIFL